ncbi:MAG TPA: S8 family serine peptidase [Xanthobacteraceae bacterium]|nr:S8 family serine peptidase [Xanthobacteraceae bacterium]
MWPRGRQDPTQNGATQNGSTRLIQAGAAILLMSAIAILGPGFTGKAGAIDFPSNLTNVLKKKGAERPKAALPVPKQTSKQPLTGAKQVLGNSQTGTKGFTATGSQPDTRFRSGNTTLPSGTSFNPANSKLGTNTAVSKGLPGNQTGTNLLNNKLGTNTALGKGLPGNSTGPNLLNNKLGTNAALGKGLPGNPTGPNLLNNKLGTNAALGKGLPGTGLNSINSKAGLPKTTFANNALGHSATTRLINGRAANFQNVHSRIAVTANLVERQRIVAEHRRDLMTWRLALPRRALPGERGFTGVPPVGETRFVSTEMMFRIGPNISQQAVNEAAQRNGLTVIASEPSGIAGGTVYHFRVAGGRPVANVVATLEAQNLGVWSPNYVYELRQESTPEVKDTNGADSQSQSLQSSNLQDANLADLAARSESGTTGQYVVGKLRLGEVHKVATGNNVLIAIIDSKIDVNHPDLAGAIVEQYDATGRAEESHSHGTGMVGAIVAHQRILGIAPAARILAVTAFSTSARQTAEATTKNILNGMDWAISKGARVINMSFAGPYDPLLQLAMKNAAAKGVVLIAASGNSGPKSPPLYPAADPNVIAVTATDQNDKPFPQAVRGPHVAVAAPGVDVMVPAPDNTYQLTTGTSVATAHVTGVAALLIERHPTVSAATVLEVLTSSAKRLTPKGRDDQFGWGLIDPASALADLDARMESSPPQVANQLNLQSAPKTAAATKAGTPKASVAKSTGTPNIPPRTTSAVPR